MAGLIAIGAGIITIGAGIAFGLIGYSAAKATGTNPGDENANAGEIRTTSIILACLLESIALFAEVILIILAFK